MQTQSENKKLNDAEEDIELINLVSVRFIKMKIVVYITHENFL